MGQIIGKNTLVGAPTSASGTNNKLLYGTGQEAVLSANQKLIGAYIGWGGKSANPTGNPVGEVGLFDVSGSNYTTAPVIFSVAYSFSNAALTGAQWIYIPLNVDVSAHAGKTLAPAFAAPSVGNAFDVLIETVAGANRKNGSAAQTTLQATLGSGAVNSNQAWSLYFETETIGASVALDSVLPASQNNAGQFTAIFSGNAPSGTVDLLANGLTIAQDIASWNYNSGTNKTTVVTNVTQAGIPFGAATIRYTTTSVFTSAVTLVPISGNAKIDIAAPQNGAGYIFEQLETGNYLDVTQVEFTDSPNTTVSSTGVITQTSVGAFQARARDGADKTWSTFSTINPYVAQVFSVTGSGGILSDGAADVQWDPALAAEYSYTGVGGEVFSGAAATAKTKSFFPVGGLVVSGSGSYYKQGQFVISKNRTLFISSQSKLMTSAIYKDFENKDASIKDPDAKLDYSFDWTEWLADQEDTISIFSFYVAGGIRIESTSLSGAVVTAFIAGGVVGVKGTLTCEITTAGGRIDQRSLVIYIHDL